MARTVDTSSTFEQWRQNYNTLATEVGDPAALTTADKSSVVNAINYLMDQYFFFQDFDYDGSDGAASGGSDRRLFSGVDNSGNTLQYMASKVLVYKDGALLRNGTDYIAIDGTSVILTSTAATDAVIRISSYTGSYTATPAGQESLFHWQTAGDNIYNRNSGGLVVNVGKAVGSLVTAPTVTDSIQLDGPVYATGTLAVTGAATLSNTLNVTSHLYMPDSAIVQLGAAGDLRLYHDGSNSYITNSTGALTFAGSQIILRNAAADETMLHTSEDGAVILYYDNAAKLHTQSDGIEITGDINTDTLTVSGVATFTGVPVLPANTIDSDHYVDGSIDTAHYAANSVDATAINVSGNGTSGYALISDGDGSFSYAAFSGSNTTYTHTWVDSSDDVILRLTDSNATNDDVKLVAGSGITLTPSNSDNDMTIAATASLPTAITVAAEDSDTTCFPAFFTAATGDLGPKTDSSYTYNSSSNTLSVPSITCTSIVGTLTGGASQVYVTTASGNTNYRLILGEGNDAGGANETIYKVDNSGVTYNPSTNTLTTGTFAGNLTGNLTGNVTGNVSGNVTGNTSGTAATVTSGTQAAITTAANLVTVGTIGTGVWQGTAIATGYIAADAINSSKIEDNAIGNEHLEDDTVGIAELSASGTASSSTFLRGDNSWAAAGAGTVDTSGSPVDNDFAKFTDANTIEGRSYAEVRSDLGIADLEILDWTADQGGSNIHANNVPNASTAAVADTVTVSDESSDTTCNVLFATQATGNLGVRSGTNLVFNSSSGTLTCTEFSVLGTATANVLAGTLSTAAQTNITSLGTLTSLTVDNVIINATTIGHTSDTDLMTLSDGGLVVSGTLQSTGAATFTNNVYVAGSNKELRFYEAANYVGFEAPALSANQIWVLPSADGSANQVLKTDGSGTLSWATTSGAVSAIANFADNRVVTASSATALNGEAGLTFDGNDLAVNRYVHCEGVGLDPTDWMSFSNNSRIMFTVDNEERMRINGDISGTALDSALEVEGDIIAFASTYSSDIALKENINPITNALDKLIQLGGYTFDWKNKKRGSSTGLIAQEVEKVLPDLVKDQNGLHKHKTLNYNGIIGLLVESIKELKNEVESLKNSKS